MPTFGICYGFQAMAAGARRRGRADRRSREFGGTAADVPAARACSSRGLPAEQSVWMCHGDCVAAAPAGFTVTAATAGSAGRRVRGPRARPGRRAVPPRGRCTPRTARRCCEHFLVRRRRHRAHLDDAQHHRRAGRGDPRPGRRQARASAGCPAASTPRSPPRWCSGRSATSSPASSSTTACCARARPSRSSATSSPPPASSSRSSTPRAVPRRARRGHRPRGEAQDHRPRVHPGLRGRPRGAIARGATASRSTSWCRARSTPTWSSPAAAPAPPTSSRTTTSAACPTTCSSRWSSRCARCSRTRCAAVGRGARPARGDRLAPAVPRPGPGHPHHRRGHRASGSTSCARPTRSPARS